MYLRHLELANYRNFRRLSLALPDGPVILRGDNGQGKTNLLEAVELLATAKSSRAGSDRELIHWAMLLPASLEPFARVRGSVVRGDDELRAEILVQAGRDSPDGQPSAAWKRFRVNGVDRRALEFVGTINAVSFSPEAVSLVAGPPSVRRRHLDIMNSQTSNRYLYALQRYQKVLLQRNHLLRQMRSQGSGGGNPTLEVWTEQLASEGAFLVLERLRSVRDLAKLAAHWFCELAGPDQLLELRYRPTLSEGSTERLTEAGLDEDALSEIHREFLDGLRRVEARERAAGMSLVGPHRDDLRFALDGVDLHVYGSRGQQRLAALAIKLGEADLLERRAGSRPILLLDDVLSELDRHRQQAVLRFVADQGQSLVSVTSLEGVDWSTISHAPVFEVDAGIVSLKEGRTPTL